MRDHGGSLDSDPQAQLISRLSFRYIAPSDVGLGVVLLLVIMVELISAFAPVVLNEAAAVHRATSAPVAVGRGLSRADAAHRNSPVSLIPIGDIFEYLSAQIIPDTKGLVSAQALFSGYKAWCAVCGFSVLDENRFFASFDRIVEDDMGGHVQRRGSDYFGFRPMATLSGEETTCSAFPPTNRTIGNSPSAGFRARDIGQSSGAVLMTHAVAARMKSCENFNSDRCAEVCKGASLRL